MHPCGVVQEQMPPWPGLFKFTLLSPFAHVPYFAVHAFTQPPATNGVVLHDGAADTATAACVPPTPHLFSRYEFTAPTSAELRLAL